MIDFLLDFLIPDTRRGWALMGLVLAPIAGALLLLWAIFAK